MRNMRLISRNETGFTIIHGLMAVAVIFIVGFAGWYVSRSEADNKQAPASNTETNANQEQSQDGQNSGFNLPNDWQWYENKELGFKFAYPKTFGNISLITEYCCGLTQDDFPDIAAQYKSEAPADPGIPNVKDDFLLDIYKADKREILSRKYGPKIRMMPNDGRWVVTKPNPDDPAQYREGMIYLEVTKTKSAGGVDVHAFEIGDEGLVSYQLVFHLKDRLYMITMPNFDTGMGLGDGPPAPNDRKPFEAWRDQIAQSITQISS